MWDCDLDFDLGEVAPLSQGQVPGRGLAVHRQQLLGFVSLRRDLGRTPAVTVVPGREMTASCSAEWTQMNLLFHLLPSPLTFFPFFPLISLSPNVSETSDLRNRLSANCDSEQIA